MLAAPGQNSTQSTDNNDRLNNNEVNKRRVMNINMIVTNARSLAPKMPCLLDNFNELELSFAIGSNGAVAKRREGIKERPERPQTQRWHGCDP